VADGQPSLGLKVYFAGPLFSQPERRWNREVAERLEREAGCSVILPQDFKVGESLNDRRHFAALFQKCIQSVKEADVVLAVVDGPDADSGTAFEMGYAFALGKPVIGVRTDYRRQQERGTNLMLSRACSGFVHVLSFNEDIGAVVAEIRKRLERLTRKPSTRTRTAGH